MPVFYGSRFVLLTVCAAMACQVTQSSAPELEERGSPYDSIRLLRDAHGVPHIYASTDEGAVYGAGYAAAEDRLFQMHLARMKYKGRLAEIFGREVKNQDGSTRNILDMDRKYRTYGLEQHMEQVLDRLDADTVALLEAYSDGVNASVAAQGQLPPVFETVRVDRFEPWTPTDSLLAYLLLAGAFAKDALGETKTENKFNSDVEDACGEDVSEECLDAVRADWLYHIIDEEAAVIPPPETSAKRSPGMTQVPRNTKASHAWAIGGEHTTTGKPFLNGRPMVLDRVFYQSHIQGATFDVQGIGVPGLFGYMIGMTPHTAWSLTSMNVDNADLFRLSEGAAPNSYQIGGSDIALEVREETLTIRGEASERLVVRSSRFGVIVNDLLPAADVEPNTLYAQRYIVTEFAGDRVHPVEALLGMMRADHWETFREEGMDYWSYPNANLVYADDGTEGPAPRSAGNICYRPATVLPVRSTHAPMYGLLPQDADQWDDNWTGYLGVETIPEICNPSKGYLVSANHLPVGSWWGHYGLGGGGDTYRSWHIKRELQAMVDAGPVSTKANEAFHRDSGQSVLNEFIELAHWYRAHSEHGTLTARAALALRILTEWNGEARLDVPEYRIASWEVGGSYPIDVNFRQYLKEEYGDRDYSHTLFFKRFAEDPLSALIVENEDGETVDLRADGYSFVNGTLVDFWNEATDSAAPPSCSADPMACLLPHTTEGTIKYGGYLGTFADFPGGSAYDLTVEHHGAASLNTVWSVPGNMYSQVVQLGRPDATETLVAGGNSLNPDSPYFDNTVDEWVNGQHYSTPMDRRRIEATALEKTDLWY